MQSSEFIYYTLFIPLAICAYLYIIYIIPLLAVGTIQYIMPRDCVYNNILL